MPPTPYPFEYLSQETLERRLDAPESIRASLGATDSEWSSLLEDVIAEESAWAHGVVTDEAVTPSAFPGRAEFLSAYPQVRRAMVRLCRASIHEIESDGLEQESAEDRSEIYRPPEAIRNEVAAELAALDPPDDDAPDGLRVGLI